MKGAPNENIVLVWCHVVDLLDLQSFLTDTVKKNVKLAGDNKGNKDAYTSKVFSDKHSGYF